MLALRLAPSIEKRLARLAKKTGRTKTFYAQAAIAEYLEDMEDYYLAMQRLERKVRGIPLDELERRLGLED